MLLAQIGVGAEAEPRSPCLVEADGAVLDREGNARGIILEGDCRRGLDFGGACLDFEEGDHALELAGHVAGSFGTQI
ncbi:hypothetical protein D3C72_911540 [compost metagenome]